MRDAVLIEDTGICVFSLLQVLRASVLVDHCRGHSVVCACFVLNSYRNCVCFSSCGGHWYVRVASGRTHIALHWVRVQPHHHHISMIVFNRRCVAHNAVYTYF